MLTSAPISMLASILLLTLFCIGFDTYAKHAKDTSRKWLPIVSGGLLGVIAIGLMCFNIQHEGVAFDFRTVLLCLSGLFYGTAPTIVATAIATLFTVIQGTGEMPATEIVAECTYTIAAGATGILFGDASHNWRSSRSMKVIATASIVTQVIMALCLYIAHRWHDMTFDFAFVTLMLMPTVTMLIGKLTSNRIKHFEIILQYQQLEDKYYKLILCNDDIFWEFDPSGRVKYVSANVTQTLGYDRKELVGRTPHYFIEDVPSMQLVTDYGKFNEKPGNDLFRHQLVLKHKKGNNVYCDTRCMSIIDPAIHKTSGFVCVTRNITNAHLHDELSRHNQKFIREQTLQLNKLQNDIQDYKSRLTQASKDIEEARKTSNATADRQLSMLSNICNDIIPTVDDIYKYATILRDPMQTDAAKNIVIEQLLYASEFLNTLAADVMDTDAIHKGHIKLTLSIDNIEETIDEICDYHNSRNIYLLKKPIIMQRDVNLKPDEKIIKTDIHHLRRIINILVDNAYIFTNTGQITVGCSLQSDTELLISVADTGIGIPEAAYKNMFMPYNEKEYPPFTKNKVIKHSCLGLSICKSLVELMGGHIWYVSGIGKGTTISFTIPFVKAGEIATQNNVQYNWQNYTALVATSNRYNGILACETIAKTHINYRSIHIDGMSAPPDSEYYKHYDILITDNDAAWSAIVRDFVQCNPSIPIITINDNTSPTTIYTEIDKYLTEKK